MAILQALLAALSRSLGRLLNTAFGWATTLLFGKVPERRQLFLSVIGLGSVLWAGAALGVAFPSVGTFLLAMVTLPDWVDRAWVRLAMLAAAALLPALVGVAPLFLVDPPDRPPGLSGKLKAILRGYPYTVGLALTLLMMLIVAPLMKVRDLARGWTGTHVPVVVEPGDYAGVLEEARVALAGRGYATRREPAGWMIRVPTRVFTFFAGGPLDDLVARELSVLTSESLEVLLHPSDLVIRGKKADVARAQAALAERLSFSAAYLTWTKEAQQVEDRLAELCARAGAGRSGGLEELRAVGRDLERLDIPYEEWEVLFRERLLVECALLRAGRGGRQERAGRAAR